MKKALYKRVKKADTKHKHKWVFVALNAGGRDAPYYADPYEYPGADYVCSCGKQKSA